MFVLMFMNQLQPQAAANLGKIEFPKIFFDWKYSLMWKSFMVPKSGNPKSWVEFVLCLILKGYCFENKII